MTEERHVDYHENDEKKESEHTTKNSTSKNTLNGNEQSNTKTDANDDDESSLLQGMETLEKLSKSPAIFPAPSSDCAARPPASSSSLLVRSATLLLRSLFLDLPLLVLFAMYASVLVLEQIHDQYLGPQMKLMTFANAERQWTDVTYYHRICTAADITATSVDQLLLPANATRDDAVQHMLHHGATLYPNLLTPETAWALREFIVEENTKQEGWFVIENNYRYSWGIDVNMHPAFKAYWKELASNTHFVRALEGIVGPNPAIIEFTAITSSYRAKDQHDHQDVVPPGSGAKFARSFVPSYSLFIPLQDTTYEMGATHVCPGSHMCSEGGEEYCPDHNLAMSGESNLWPQGWGALLNQQTFHKGMGHTDPTAIDRVVLVATFAPRPRISSLETRMIAQGGSYSLLWSQWGHTFHDFAHADTRMTEPQGTLRSLGFLKGKGWNYMTVASMRLANGEVGFHAHDLDSRLEKGGFPFLPQAWHGQVDDAEEPGAWYNFLKETFYKTKDGLRTLNVVAHSVYLSCMAMISMVLYLLGRSRKDSNPSSSLWLFVRCLRRLIVMHGMLVGLAVLTLQTMSQTTWARNIRNGKAFQLPNIENIEDDSTFGTLPLESDVLLSPHYASDYLASYTQLLDVTHRGNKNWKSLARLHGRGYEQLSPALQSELALSIIQWVQATPSRFLIQNRKRKWTTVTDEKALVQLCHKELILASNPMTRALVRQVESLRAETQWGRWHDMAIHQSAIPAYLQQWEDRLLPPLLPKVRAASRQQLVSPMAYMTVVGSVNRLAKTKRALRSSRRNVTPMDASTSTHILQHVIEEGDVVEAKYQCVFNEWYRGTVSQVWANEGTLNVVFEDGETDEQLRPNCVRPFQPYKVGEVVESRDDESEYLRGTVVKIHPYARNGDGLYDVQMEHGALRTMVSTLFMRRFDPEANDHVEVGTAIKARYARGREWFTAKVTEVNPDGSYNVQYYDGDFEKSIPREFIHVLKEE